MTGAEYETDECHYRADKAGYWGVLWSGPIADLAMAIVAGVLFRKEIRKLEA